MTPTPEEKIELKRRGRRVGQNKLPRTDISIKAIKLDANKPFGIQLKVYREFLNISLTEMGKRINFHSSNIYHFENNTGGLKSVTNTLTQTALKYTKALGVNKIEIIL